MRISGGSLRGRTVICPPGVIRPAMDRMRESMFSILGDLNDLSFLDLFSGSGLVGLEAWSRGSRPVVLVEKDRGKRRDILANITDLAPAPTLRVEPVERFIARNRTSFDVVYLDPPFAYRYKADLLSRIATSSTIHERSRILIHAPRQETLSPEKVGLVVEDRREYGGSAVTFFRPPPA
ncbi:MAG: 16S rRNA (guanine(966)-N(2))-methyltransferase RsmD [Alkalispirochaeta sp.]